MGGGMPRRPCSDFDHASLLDDLQQHPDLKPNQRKWITRLADNYFGYGGLSDREIEILKDIAAKVDIEIDADRWAFP